MMRQQQFPLFSIGLSVFLLSICLCMSPLSWAEEQTAETAIAAKVIQGQQAANANETGTGHIAASQSPLNHDPAEGELKRSLPSLDEPVIDQAQSLSPQDKQAIDQKIRSLYEAGKAQIGVVIVPRTGQEDIFEFALRVAEQWQLGSAKQDNGLLIAIAVEDRRIQILSGYGLEGVLPDVVLNRIIHQNITPYFKQGQYGQGIQAGLTEIERILNLDPEIAAQAAQTLQERQNQAIQEQEAKNKTFNTALFILIAGAVGSLFVGKRLSASTAAVAGVTAGLVNGAGIVMSLLIGGGIFFLLITSLAQTVVQLFLSSRGGGGRGGRGGGGFGGGGYRGGGGGFGGGGASGSW